MSAAVDVLYAGGLANVNTSGYVAAASATQGEKFAGVVAEQCDNSAGVAGGKTAVILRKGEHLLGFNGTAVAADVGKHVYVSDDANVRLTQPGVGNVFCGIIVEFVSATEVWVDIEPATRPMLSRIEVLTGDLVAGTGTSGGEVLSLANPWGQTAHVLEFLMEITTPATGTPTVDAGIAANGTTSNDTLNDGAAIGDAAKTTSINDLAGTNGVVGKTWDTGEFLTVTPSASAVGLVGTYKVVVVLTDPR